MRVAIVSDNLTSNSVGRAYSLWLLLEHLNHETCLVAPRVDRIWAPVSQSDFGAIPRFDHDTFQTMRRPDITVCVKPLPESIALTKQVTRTFWSPTLLDIDDPDIEAGLGIDLPRRLGKHLLRPKRTASFYSARRFASRTVRVVSNPELQKKYGGQIIPHVRPKIEAAPYESRESDILSIVFVGTNRPHKGVQGLRNAVALVRDKGFRLTITDTRPPDAQDWETWVGRTSLNDGLELVKSADIVVVPSEYDRFSAGQLPAKLIDGISSGRPVVASDLPPIRWALGDDRYLYAPGDVSALSERLLALRSPEARHSAARHSVSRAHLFSIERNAPLLQLAIDDAIQAHRFF